MGNERPRATFKPISGGEKPAPAPALELRPLAAGERPRYDGLSPAPDAPATVIGAQGLLVVAGHTCCAALLAALSRVHDLSNGVTVEVLPAAEAHGGRKTCVISLTPPDSRTPSHFYALVHGSISAARLSRRWVQFFTGDGRVFVPYGDPDAPHGYDVLGPPPTTGRVLLTPAAPPQSLPTVPPHPLLDMVLSVPLQPARPPAPPTTLAVLTDRRQAALVADYVQRHGLSYAVRFLRWPCGPQARPVALFDLVTAGVVRPIPPFVSDFLRRLPRTLLLTDAAEAADLEHEPAQRVLVAQGWQTPLWLPNILGVLPTRSLLILGPPRWGAASIADPPLRQSIQARTRVTFSAPGRLEVDQPVTPQVSVPLALWPDIVRNRPVHGLLLDQVTLQRLRRLMYYLPRPLFAHVQIALDAEATVALLIANDPPGTIAGLPLGLPLSRREPPELLLPRTLSLRPTLPLDLLVPALGLERDTLTILTPTHRYQVPCAALQPLGRLVCLDWPAQPLAMTITPLRLPDLPRLDLPDLSDEPSAPPASAPAEPASPEQPARGWWSRLLGNRPHPPANTSFAQELRRRAAQLEQAGDYLSAAVFYAHLGDNTRASACYEQVLQLQRRDT